MRNGLRSCDYVMESVSKTLCIVMVILPIGLASGGGASRLAVGSGKCAASTLIAS